MATKTFHENVQVKSVKKQNDSLCIKIRFELNGYHNYTIDTLIDTDATYTLGKPGVQPKEY